MMLDLSVSDASQRASMTLRGVQNIAAVLATFLIGLGSDGPSAPVRGDDPSRRSVGTHMPVPQRLEAAGIENLYRLGPSLYSGGQPDGERGFETLKRLGVKTIITVAGARPDVDAAHRLGMRYVHLPVGYDGIPREQAVRLVKAMTELPGPVFVHCHHGKHRGPSAAALCGMAAEGWTREQARAWLDRAGTDPKYKGLFATVERFTPPSAEELGRVAPGDLPERAAVPGLVETMVQIDALWDRLKAIKAAGFRTPPGQPDVDPPHEAAMLGEQFREARRHDDVGQRGNDLLRLMSAAGQDAAVMEAALKVYAEKPSAAARDRAEAAFAKAERNCTACHPRFRDTREAR